MEDTRPKRTYLICPVRNVDPDLVEPVVLQLEAEGWDVYCPDQDDDTGFNVLDTHRFATTQRPFVHLLWPHHREEMVAFEAVGPLDVFGQMLQKDGGGVESPS